MLLSPLSAALSEPTWSSGAATGNVDTWVGFILSGTGTPTAFHCTTICNECVSALTSMIAAKTLTIPILHGWRFRPLCSRLVVCEELVSSIYTGGSNGYRMTLGSPQVRRYVDVE